MLLSVGHVRGAVIGSLNYISVPHAENRLLKSTYMYLLNCGERLTMAFELLHEAVVRLLQS